ncbi:MAG: hypothetical protein ACYDA8_18790 [Deferrisomatales bacterium]
MRVSDELRQYLKSQPFAALCLVLDLGNGDEAVVVVKSTADLLAGLRAAGAAAEVGWVVERTPRGPVLCLVGRASAPEVGELAAEVYFDPADPADGELVALLAGQARLRVAFLDEELSSPWVAEVPWDEVRRLEAEQVWDRAEELLERVTDYDFEAAKEWFQEELPLGRLLARAFPEAP